MQCVILCSLLTPYSVLRSKRIKMQIYTNSLTIDKNFWPDIIYLNSRIYEFHVLIAMVNCHHLLFQMCHPDRHSRRSPRGSCRGRALLPALLHPLSHEWVVDKFSATFKFSLQFQPTVPGLRCPQAAISSFKIRRLNIHWTSLQAPRCTNVKAF